MLAREVARLARRVKSLEDEAMRASYVRAELQRLPVEVLTEVLALAFAGASVRDEDHEALWLAVTIALASPELAEARRRASLVARERGDDELVRVLDRADATPDGGSALPLPYNPGGKPLTLGERKSLARRPRRDVLLRALRDPHPDVIRILLGNPHVTEDDIVRLCARRPVAAEILREVARSPRFVVRERVRIALVKNPYTPLDVALGLVAGLKSQDARAVAESPELAAPLRDAARRHAHGVTIH